MHIHTCTHLHMPSPHKHAHTQTHTPTHLHTCSHTCPASERTAARVRPGSSPFSRSREQGLRGRVCGRGTETGRKSWQNSPGRPVPSGRCPMVMPLLLDDTVFKRDQRELPLTSHLLSVMGLMLKSLTRLRSWYMCSRQLSICGHRRGRGGQQHAGARPAVLGDVRRAHRAASPGPSPGGGPSRPQVS